MAGDFNRDLVDGVTHVVASSVGSEKYSVFSFLTSTALIPLLLLCCYVVVIFVSLTICFALLCYCWGGLCYEFFLFVVSLPERKPDGNVVGSTDH